MDIQVNMTNIKPDPWGQAKDKLYKCPHCDTAFARRQYLRLAEFLHSLLAFWNLTITETRPLPLFQI